MKSLHWVNVEDEGALPALLRRLEAEIPAERIDELWIFPTRRAAGAESTVLVLSAFSDEADRRRVGAIHFKVIRDRRGRPSVEHDLREFATAPANAVQRVVDGVLLRLGDEADHPPRCESIAGDTARFEDLIRELGGAPKPASDETREHSRGTDTGGYGLGDGDIPAAAEAAGAGAESAALEPAGD